MLNVLTGQRYKVVPKEVKAYVKGMYGRPPGAHRPGHPAADPRRRAAHHRRARPTAWSPSWTTPRPELGDLARSDEDVVSYALFPQIAREFFERRQQGDGRGHGRGRRHRRRALAQRRRSRPSRRPRLSPAASPWKLAGRASGLHGLGGPAMKLTVDGKSFRWSPGDSDSILGRRRLAFKIKRDANGSLITVLVNGKPYKVDLANGTGTAIVDGPAYQVSLEGTAGQVAPRHPRRRRLPGARRRAASRSLMPGKVVR